MTTTTKQVAPASVTQQDNDAAKEQSRSAFESLLALPSKSSLLLLMVQRDFIGRYKGSMLGALWPILNPLGHMLLYTFLFSVILKIRFTTNGTVGDFAMYLMAGFLPWTATGEALTVSSKKILEEPNYVTRVVFPLELLPLVAACSNFLSCILSLFLLGIFVLFKTHAVPATVLLLPLVLIPHFLFTVGLCWLLAALGVFLRDLQHFIALALSAWMYATPIIYPVEMIPDNLKFMLWVNPMAGIILDYRRLILESQPIDLSMYAVYSTVSVLTFFFGYYIFHKLKKGFADVI